MKRVKAMLAVLVLPLLFGVAAQAQQQNPPPAPQTGNVSRGEEEHQFEAGLKQEKKAFMESIKDLKGKERGKAISEFNRRQRDKRQAFHRAQHEQRKTSQKEREGDKPTPSQKPEGKTDMRPPQREEHAEKNETHSGTY